MDKIHEIDLKLWIYSILKVLKKIFFVFKEERKHHLLFPSQPQKHPKEAALPHGGFPPNNWAFPLCLVFWWVSIPWARSIQGSAHGAGVIISKFVMKLLRQEDELRGYFTPLEFLWTELRPCGGGRGSWWCWCGDNARDIQMRHNHQEGDTFFLQDVHLAVISPRILQGQGGGLILLCLDELWLSCSPGFIWNHWTLHLRDWSLKCPGQTVTGREREDTVRPSVPPGSLTETESFMQHVAQGTFKMCLYTWAGSRERSQTEDDQTEKNNKQMEKPGHQFGAISQKHQNTECDKLRLLFSQNFSFPPDQD